MKMDNEIIFYTSPEGKKKVEVVFQDENFWLSQKRMTELFAVEVNTINYHLKEIFKSGELSEDSVIRKIRITADDGKNYLTAFYSWMQSSPLDTVLIATRQRSLESGQLKR